MGSYGLLAISLIAQGYPISDVKSLPQPVPPELNSARSTLPQILDFASNLLAASFPTVETFAPEFSSSAPSTPVSTLPKKSYPSKINRPVSGVQLYRQRLAALKMGKIYTRLPVDSFHPVWTRTKGQPTHEQWQYLLDLEARAIASGQGENRLNILLGDSLSLWFPVEFLPAGRLWLNQGISGETTHQILKRLSALKPTRPDKIYLMAGINDLRQGASDRQILENTYRILQHLRQHHPRSRAIVQSILPTRLAAISNRRIRRLNRQLEAIAERQGADYLDIYALFADDRGELRRDLTTDGLHLNRQGYRVWARSLKQTEFPQPYSIPEFLADYQNPPPLPTQKLTAYLGWLDRQTSRFILPGI